MAYSTGDKENMGAKFAYSLLALALLGVGAFILYDVYVYNASKSWPSLDAKVIESWSKCVSGKKRNCSAHVRYSYLDLTAEAEIHSDTFFKTNDYRTNEALKPFRQGSVIKVHYDPARPRRSRPAGGGAMDWRLGLLLAGVGWLIIYSTWQLRGEQDPGAPVAERTGAGAIAFIGIAGLLGLLLPAAIIMLLGAGGLLPGASFATPGGRWAALANGMFLGGFGVCAAPLGLPLLLKWFLLPQKAATFVSEVLTRAWVAGAALLGLAAYAVRTLYPQRNLIETGENLVFGGLALLAGVSVRAYLDWTGKSK